MEALTGPQDCIDDNIGIYQWRRDRVLQALSRMGLSVETPRASLYIWAPVPEGFTSADFAARLLEENRHRGYPRLLLRSIRRRLYPPLPHHAR